MIVLIFKMAITEKPDLPDKVHNTSGAGTMDKLDAIAQQLQSIEQKLELIDSRLDTLKTNAETLNVNLIALDSKITTIQQSSANMDSHIATVDGIYNQVKEPFHSMMDAASYYFGSNTAITDGTDK